MVLLGADGEAVDVDLLVGDTSVVSCWLDEAEVLGGARFDEARVVVELELRGSEKVLGDDARVARGSRGGAGVVEPVVVGWALSVVIVVLNGPDELLDWVVEVERDVVPCGAAKIEFCALGHVLQLFDQVEVFVSSEPLALVGVEIDEVDVEVATAKLWRRDSLVGV